MSTLLLDIDGVLLPWGALPKEIQDYKTHHPRAVTGWTDWEQINRDYFSWISRDQLRTIESSFDRVIWLTTWEVHGDMRGANVHFSDTLGIDHFERFPSLVTGNIRGQAHGPDWWKLDVVLEDLAFLGNDDIVWVDDELTRGTLRGVETALTEAGVRDRFTLHAPTVVLTKKSLDKLTK